MLCFFCTWLFISCAFYIICSFYSALFYRTITLVFTVLYFVEK